MSTIEEIRAFKGADGIIYETLGAATVGEVHRVIDTVWSSSRYPVGDKEHFRDAILRGAFMLTPALKAFCDLPAAKDGSTDAE